MAWLLCSKTIKIQCRFSKFPYSYDFEYLFDGFNVKMSPRCICNGENDSQACKDCWKEMSEVFSKIQNQDDMDAMLKIYGQSR